MDIEAENQIWIPMWPLQEIVLAIEQVFHYALNEFDALE
jgi:hypothetical protein